MEAEARWQKHPGAGTSHHLGHRRTVQKEVGGGREAIAWHKAQQYKLRPRNGGVIRKESREEWMLESGTVSIAA